VRHLRCGIAPPERRFLERTEGEEAHPGADDADEEHAAPAPNLELRPREGGRDDRQRERGEQRADAGSAAADETGQGAASALRFLNKSGFTNSFFNCHSCALLVRKYI
jgi:hypothetical protein